MWVQEQFGLDLAGDVAQVDHHAPDLGIVEEVGGDEVDPPQPVVRWVHPHPSALGVAGFGADGIDEGGDLGAVVFVEDLEVDLLERLAGDAEDSFGGRADVREAAIRAPHHHDVRTLPEESGLECELVGLFGCSVGFDRWGS